MNYNYFFSQFIKAVSYEIVYQNLFISSKEKPIFKSQSNCDFVF